LLATLRMAVFKGDGMSVLDKTQRKFRLPPHLRGEFDLGRLTRFSGILFAFLGLVSGVATYLVLSNVTPLRPSTKVIWSLLSLNIFIVAGLLLVISWQLLRLRRARLAGRAGALLHGRLVSLFAVIAAVPAILVAVFAIVTFDRGLDSWFSDRTKSIINNTTAVANAYVSEHRLNLRRDVSMMVNDLSRAASFYESDPRRFQKFLAAQAGLRSVPQALIVERNGNVLMAASPDQELVTELPPPEAFAAAQKGPVLITIRQKSQVRALMEIPTMDGKFVYVTRLLQENVMQHLAQTDLALRDYSSMEERRYEAQLTFAMVYIVLTLVILLSAIWLGLSLADRLVQPISRLIWATQRLGEGNWDVRVDAGLSQENSEIGQLAQTFNDMAGRLGDQQQELVTARDDFDERATFTEMVLHGVSSGVVGVDEQGRINHINDVAGELFGRSEHQIVGRALSEVMPEFEPIARKARELGKRVTPVQISKMDTRNNPHILQASASVTQAEREAVVITFDDVTDMVAAQRNAAWSDIARRIAHEIKNPLTPIQLSAERLQSKYGDKIADESGVFQQCTDTIIRQVGDIGNMVDEFAAFARMPEVVFKRFDVTDIVSHAVFLQRVAHPNVHYVFETRGELYMFGDPRQLSQALTNVLKNAEESLSRWGDDKAERRIEISVEAGEDVKVMVSDTGPGWPNDNRYALLEPYNTSRQQGTGLGLSIVKKVMDDHGGQLILEDAPWCSSGGSGATIVMVFPQQEETTVGPSKILEEM
jgi:two-component system nitrogen regulation sensor histidine kinase NtrY